MLASRTVAEMITAEASRVGFIVAKWLTQLPADAADAAAGSTNKLLMMIVGRAPWSQHCGNALSMTTLSICCRHRHGDDRVLPEYTGTGRHWSLHAAPTTSRCPNAGIDFRDGASSLTITWRAFVTCCYLAIKRIRPNSRKSCRTEFPNKSNIKNNEIH